MLKIYGVSNLPVRYDVGSWEAAKLTVLRGTGVTILARQWVADELSRGDLEQLKFDDGRLRASVLSQKLDDQVTSA